MNGNIIFFFMTKFATVHSAPLLQLMQTVHYFISEMIILFGKHQVLLIGKTDQPSDYHEQNVCQE